ncbi:MAG TPA: GTP diphosphokinase [Anaerolineae bacterium]|nr:GTP diphosphokinase [Anaerolineae bacterium]
MTRHPALSIQSILDTLPGSDNNSNGRQLIQRAFAVADQAHQGQKRVSGEPYIQHCLAVAKILADLGLDSPTVAAGLLHDVVEDTAVRLPQLHSDFGEEIARLVDGVTKLSQFDEIEGRDTRTYDDRELESLRKMFLAMVDDPRVVMIKLADRVHNLRTLGSLSEDKRRRIARETLDIFAPLANRLGIWHLKWELEDLGFRHVNPDKYKEIARLIDERRADREMSIGQIIERLQERCKAEGINAEISGRPKHIYSIWRKMERKGVSFDQVYDVRAVRVTVDTLGQCYQTLGIVHSIWKPIPGEFDDYIAMPKDNLYQSLHTAVVGDDGRPLEVQIRTHEMHEMAELGIASHWRYKEGGRRDPKYEQKIAWFRSLMEWRQDVVDAHEFMDSMRTDVFQDRVYAFTPRGKLIDLPAGSTPIDFAYHVHTEIGDRCRGARINGKLVSLDYQLQTGDQVEILTAKRGGPSRDWLNLHLGYVKTQRARGKIKQWFKKQDRAQNVSQGRDILERELRRLSLENMPLDQVAAMFEHDRLDDFLAVIGSGDITSQQIATKVIEAEQARAAQAARDATPEEVISARKPQGPAAMSVRGTGGLLTTLAQCCHPVPGDSIVGYITRGRGISIHRRDCTNILRSDEEERFIEVSWGSAQSTYPVAIKISAYDRGGLLRDIAAVVASEGINMSSVNVSTSKNLATFIATLDIYDVAQLSRVLDKIERLPNVIEVRRQTG